MHPFLTRLQVRPEVQEFFRPFYSTDALGNLIFRYGAADEHFGFGFHRIPASPILWGAGNFNCSQVRMVIFCSSALDAVSWLNKKEPGFSSTANLLFLSSGAGILEEHLRWINSRLKKKEYLLIYGSDILGRLADLKMAAALHRLPVKIYSCNEIISVCFRSRIFSFSQETFSLHAFEKAAGFRFGVRTEKPKNHLTFFDELKAESLHTL